MQKKDQGQMSDRELLVRIDTKLDSLIVSLYGGKTGSGDIPSMVRQIEGHNIRITALEKWRWQITGAIVAGMALASTLGGTIGAWIYKLVD